MTTIFIKPLCARSAADAEDDLFCGLNCGSAFGSGRYVRLDNLAYAMLTSGRG
jgi:hypothetical protein